MKLFSTPASPFARKVRVVAFETGLDSRIDVENIVFTPVKPSRDLIPFNPAAKVPALVVDDSRTIVDSRVICEYLDSLHSGTRLFPPAGPARWRVLTNQALGDAILDAGVLIRYENNDRPEELRWSEWQDAQTAKIIRTIALLEAEADAVAGQLDIGSITVACALGYLDFRFGDSIDWRSDCPRLADWYEGFAMRESMQRTVPYIP